MPKAPRTSTGTAGPSASTRGGATRGIDWRRCAPRRLLDLLAPALREEHPTALLDELSIEGELRAALQHGRKASGKEGPSPRPPDGSHDPPAKWRLHREQGGFSIRPGSGLREDDLPLRLRVRAAYAVPTGDAFTRHSPFDFDFREDGSIAIECVGARVEADDANTMLVTAEAPAFRVGLHGFDPNRDLLVDARRIGR